MIIIELTPLKSSKGTELQFQGQGKALSNQECQKNPYSSVRKIEF